MENIKKELSERKSKLRELKHKRTKTKSLCAGCLVLTASPLLIASIGSIVLIKDIIKSEKVYKYKLEKIYDSEGDTRTLYHEQGKNTSNKLEVYGEYNLTHGNYTRDYTVYDISNVTVDNVEEYLNPNTLDTNSLTKISHSIEITDDISDKDQSPYIVAHIYQDSNKEYKGEKTDFDKKKDLWGTALLPFGIVGSISATVVLDKKLNIGKLTDELDEYDYCIQEEENKIKKLKKTL